jgi:hypothetical protein
LLKNSDNIELKLNIYLIKYDIGHNEKNSINEYLKLNKINDHFNNLQEKHVVRISHYHTYSKLYFFHILKENKDEMIKKKLFESVEFKDGEFEYDYSNQMFLIYYFI